MPFLFQNQVQLFLCASLFQTVATQLFVMLSYKSLSLFPPPLSYGTNIYNPSGNPISSSSEDIQCSQYCLCQVWAQSIVLGYFVCPWPQSSQQTSTKSLAQVSLLLSTPSAACTLAPLLFLRWTLHRETSLHGEPLLWVAAEFSASTSTLLQYHFLMSLPRTPFSNGRPLSDPFVFDLVSLDCQGRGSSLLGSFSVAQYLEFLKQCVAHSDAQPILAE